MLPCSTKKSFFRLTLFQYVKTVACLKQRFFLLSSQHYSQNQLCMKKRTLILLFSVILVSSVSAQVIRSAYWSMAGNYLDLQKQIDEMKEGKEGTR